METVAAAIDITREELDQAKEELRITYNDFHGIADMLMPKLSETIQTIREKRQTITVEMKQLMTELKDVRKFFLSSEHNEEIKRLKDFVCLCNEMEKLKKNGIIDALTETILKMEGVDDVSTKG